MKNGPSAMPPTLEQLYAEYRRYLVEERGSSR